MICLLFLILSSLSQEAPLDASALVEQAKRMIEARSFAEATNALERAKQATTDAELLERISRMLDWATSPQQLARRFAEVISKRSAPSNILLTLTNGQRGKLLRSDGTQLFLQLDGKPAARQPEEVEARSLLEATGRIPLEPEDALRRAFLALACKDSKIFRAALEKAATNLALKGRVDSAVAFERGIDPVPSRGFFLVDGQWLTFREREEALLRLEVRAAWAELSTADDPPLEELLERMRPLAEREPTVVAEELRTKREELQKLFETHPDLKKVERVLTARQELEKAREHALKLIFDENEYFYPYQPPECPVEKAATYARVQLEVDKRVAGVRVLWGNEFGKEAAGPTVQISRDFQLLVRKVKSIVAVMKKFAAEDLAEEEAPLLLDLIPTWTRELSVRNMALSQLDRKNLDRDREVDALVDATVTENRAELTQVQVTNDYRAMMGRRLVAYNERLQKAAQAHSEWMSRKGTLTHFEDDDPARKSPFDRMRLEGYKEPASENCYRGSGSPEAAHEGWCSSSGHHRNLLYPTHTELGSGVSGSFWTQNFGGGSEYTGNLIRQ